MGKYTFLETGIPGLLIIEAAFYGDERGFFAETYTKKDFSDAGINIDFVQDNHSKSAKGVLRGLHYQKGHSQTKLVRCIKGSVYDVAVDMREGSPTYGRHFGIVLSEKNRKQLLVPKNFAHGFLTLEDDTEFIYKVDDYWYPGDESGLLWNDPNLSIEWPLAEFGIDEVILSNRDRIWPGFVNAETAFLNEE